MSENVDLVRSIYADWERGDFGSFAWAHPDIELVAIGGPNPGSTVGTAAMRRAWRDFLTEWRDFRASVQDYRELDDGRVLVLVRLIGHGKGSVIDFGRTITQAGNLFEVHERRVKRLLLYWDRDRALADLGLEEGALPEETTTYDPEALARRFLAALNRRDVQAVETFYAPHAVLLGSEIGLFAGPAAIGGFFEDLLSRYDEFHGEVEEIADLGNGVGFLVTIFTARPAGSDEVVEIRLASVLTGSQSLIERQTNYTDIDEARAAAKRLAQPRD